MTYFVYILHSASAGLHYVGFSQYRGVRRRQHNRGQSRWSSRARDWREVFCKNVGSRTEARDLEKRIKARGAKRYLADLARKTDVDGKRDFL